MKTILLKIIALSLIVSTTYAQDLILPVVKVYDGDTIESRVPMPEPLDKVRVRTYGIDTPEMPAKSYLVTGKLGRAKCKKEADLALAAKALVDDLVINNGNTLLLKDYQWGKFGGRIVADVYVYDPITQKSVYIADKLIEAELAVEYFGDKKTKDWCK